MEKALWNADRNRSTAHGSTAQAAKVQQFDWRRKMSDNIAFALLVYTGLQIVVTMGALKTFSSSILPVFALVLLVVAIVPGCQLVERRWARLSDAEAADPAFKGMFNRDRLLLWIAALGLPFVVTGAIRAFEYI